MKTFCMMLALLAGGCQVYAGGGSVVSDGRTTIVRSAEIDAGPDGVEARRARTVIQPGRAP